MSEAAENYRYIIPAFSKRNRVKTSIAGITIFLLLFFAGNQKILSQQSQSFQIEEAYRMLNERGEVIISFVIPVGNGPATFTSIMSIDRVTADSISAYLNKDQFAKFLKMDIPFRVIDPPSLKMLKQSPQLEKSLSSFTYPAYNEYISIMEGYAADRPDLCRLVEFGRSVEGRKLLALKISDNPAVREDEPVLLLTSTMHGDEVTGFVILLHLIDELLQNYQTQPRVRDLLDNLEIWINPLSNPDGTYFMSDLSVYGSKRYNSNNIDLNRNFPDAEDGDHPDDKEWQPETIAMMNFMKQTGFHLAAGLHGGAELINYPWDTWPRMHPDNEWYNLISRSWADTAHHYSPEGYMTEENDGVTQGYEWYEINGGRQDYSNYFLNAREITVELSLSKVPDETELESYWEYNRRSIYRFMELLYGGVKGVVKDAVTGRPLVARVFAEGHDVDNSHVFSDTLNGYYHRLLLPGDYNFVFSCKGYKDFNVDLTVPYSGTVTADVVLEPLEGSVFYPNPFRDHFEFYLSGTGEDIFYQFYDLSGRVVKSGNQPFTGDGFQKLYAPELANGTYVVRISHDEDVFTSFIVKQ